MNAQEMAFELAAPFPANEIRFRPGATTRDKKSALPLAYIDARSVMHRLDLVCGIDGWRDEYFVLPGGCVECRLFLRIDGEWLGKSDVGIPSDQTGGDEVKAAYSDALKRAAIKWGIGRFLYDLELRWCPINANGYFTETPEIPAWATPEAYYQNRDRVLKSAVPATTATKPKIGESQKALPDVAASGLIDAGRRAIEAAGRDGLAEWWAKSLTQEQRTLLKDELEGLKKEAAQRDQDHAGVIHQWTTWLARSPSLDEVNRYLPMMSEVVRPATKSAVWQSIRDYAAKYSWEWDGTAKVFRVED